MTDPLREFDLHEALSNSRITPDPEFKNALRARLQSNRRTSPPVSQKNGWRRPLSIQTASYPEDKTMSNSRLVMFFGLGLMLVLMVALGSVILFPDGPIAGMISPEETGEFLVDDLGDVAGVWAFPGPTGYKYMYLQFNSDGSGLRDFYVEQRGTAWLVTKQDGAVANGIFRVWFEDGHLHLEEISWRGELVPEDDPIGVYEAYITKEHGVPVSLKLVAIEDKHTMRKSYTHLIPAEWVGPAASRE